MTDIMVHPNDWASRQLFDPAKVREQQVGGLIVTPYTLLSAIDLGHSVSRSSARHPGVRGFQTGKTAPAERGATFEAGPGAPVQPFSRNKRRKLARDKQSREKLEKGRRSTPPGQSQTPPAQMPSATPSAGPGPGRDRPGKDRSPVASTTPGKATGGLPATGSGNRSTPLPKKKGGPKSKKKKTGRE